MTDYRELPDEVLVQEITKWAQRRDAPAPSTPITLQVKHRHSGRGYEDGELVLRDDSVAFHEAGDARHDFSIESKRIVRVAAAGKLSKGDSNSSFTNQIIYFTEKTSVGTHMTVRMEIPALVVLVEYLQGSHPSGSARPA